VRRRASAEGAELSGWHFACDGRTESPDKLAAKGLPESLREVAEERTREINVAYELIKEARGMV
jgi:hypothetical protein